MSEIVCLSPIDGREVARRKTASPDEIRRAIESARKAQAEWARVPLADRCAAMLRFLAEMKAQNAEVTRELALQMGRPVRWGGEYGSFEGRVLAAVDIAPEALAPVVPPHKDGFTRYIRRDPLGVLLAIAPWNYPYLTAVNTTVPGIIAGNAVILKAASQTILTGERFQAAMDKAGLPEGVFQNLVLTHDDTARILGAGAVDHVTYVGSVEGGRVVERAAAGTFTSIGLELGGKDPAYVRADADLAHAAENLVDGAYFNSGQSCCGVERIYVQEAVYDRFVQAFLAGLERQYVLGDPLDAATTLGPMAATRFADVVRRQTAQAIAMGAKPHVDSSKVKHNRDGTPWLAPQVLTNVDHSMAVMTEESFGPVVGIMKVKDDAEALRLMNSSRYGLTASVWTRDEAAAQRIGIEIETGTVLMNRCDYLDPYLAWTGVKDTGRGASLSRIGYEMLTRPKSFHLRKV